GDGVPPLTTIARPSPSSRSTDEPLGSSGSLNTRRSSVGAVSTASPAPGTLLSSSAWAETLGPAGPNGPAINQITASTSAPRILRYIADQMICRSRTLMSFAIRRAPTRTGCLGGLRPSGECDEQRQQTDDDTTD